MDDIDQENQDSNPLEQDQREESPGKPGSGEGKLRLKIKTGKSDEVGGEDRIAYKSNDYPRVCNICNKMFSSGKALGGHMRIHGQATKEAAPRKKLKAQDEDTTCKNEDRMKELDNRPEKRDGDDDGHAADEYSCTICNKTFPSKKSVFGHMRCHPEREWRGSQPPAAKNCSSYSVHGGESERIENQLVNSDGATMETQVVNLMDSLPRWPVLRGIRGQKGISAASGGRETEEEEERVRDAVDELMRLAQGESLESVLTHKNRVEAYEATNSNSLTNRVEIDDKFCVSESKKRRIEECPDGYTRDCSVKKLRIDETCSAPVKNSSKGKAVLGAANFLGKPHFPGKGDRKSFTDDESDGKNSEGSLLSSDLIMSYKCERTNRLAVKNKKRRKKLRLTDLESARDGTPAAPPPEIKVVPPAAERHKCSICGKCFPSHQALGGHRASHNKVKNSHRPPTPEAPSSVAASPGEASETGHRVLGFDLNELPSMEDEDGTESEPAVGSSNCASSSHNSVA